MSFTGNMIYYQPVTGSESIVCSLCRHSCLLKPDQTGICGINKNVDGKLKNLVYGHPAAINVDPVEKKPLYHVLPGANVLSFGTVGCNFHCSFCQNWDISQVKEVTTHLEVSPEEMVEMAIRHGAEGIAYTYNEPTIFYPYAKDIGVIAREKGLINIFVSNGFESVEMIEDMKHWVDAANIDLKSWDEAYYKKELKGGLQELKDSLKRMVSAGIWIEVTTLLIEGQNDSDKDLTEMATFISQELGSDVPWHLSAFFPNYKMQAHHATQLQTLQRAEKIARDAGLHYVYLGNVGLENPTHCPECQELLIQRSGYSTQSFMNQEGVCPKCGHTLEGKWRCE
ncbi:MAG TPA: AmmeMemoRadiSam system radical SAM enzyme [Epsilonproteobacteria bacterium]|nr:AmmeMemoRadiSam system radical SAM enzyme [Campylobacterota bacterium]